MHKKLTSLFLISSDIIALAVSLFVSAYVAQFLSELLTTREYSGVWTGLESQRIPLFVMLSIILLMVFLHNGHYTRRSPWWGQVKTVFSFVVITFLIDSFVHYALQTPFSRIWIISSWLVAGFIMLFMRLLTRKICVKLRIWNIPTIIYADAARAIDTSFVIFSDHYPGYRIAKIVLIGEKPADFHDKMPNMGRDIEIVEGCQDFSEILRENKDAYFIIPSGSFSKEELDDLIEKFLAHDCLFSIVPSVRKVSMYGFEAQEFFGHEIVLLNYQLNIKSPIMQLCKRIFDIFGSIVAILIFSPIFAFIMIALKREGGDIFFVQPRIGKGEKHFQCYKFRSMIPNADQVLQELLARDPEAKEEFETFHKLKNDPRITATGHFLRKTSFDELPQLLNVLKGEMSLVGPRPMPLFEHEIYGPAIKYYSQVLPGITGLWQVSGRNNLSFEKRVVLDSWYVRNWSLWMDIVILFLTIKVVVLRKGSF